MCAALCLAQPAPAAAAAPRPTALLLFAAAGERELAAAGMDVGIMSASQGGYQPAQLLLDIGQGSRVASSEYSPPAAPSLVLRPGGTIAGWARALARARAAPQLLTPGLLGSGVPGGAAYAGVTGEPAFAAPAAAGTTGGLAAVSLGSAATLPRRIGALLARHALVVADLPGAGSRALLERILRTRPRGNLVIVVQRLAAGARGELLWAAAALRDGGGRELTSATTEQRGLVSAVDVAPTILEWIGARVPSEMRGRRLEASGALEGGSLRALMARLRVTDGRRLTALALLLCAWIALLGLAAASRRPALVARALRAGATGMLFSPLVTMATGALEPSAGAEYAAVALGCIALGAATDALVAWPRAPLVPAVACVAAIVADALAHGQLMIRSLLGPEPALGARFYGVGNELKSGLAVLVLAAVAAALHPGRRDRRALAVVLAAGVALAAVEGSARIGAGVGGVILVCAGTAVAALMLAPGALTRRRALLALSSPVVALIALAGLDLATAHGSGHFTGSILHARSAGDIRDIIVRRYTAAWLELRNHAMPAATALALLAACWGVVRRARLTAPVGGDPVWVAALAGGLAAGVAGALVEDSGPLLLVVAVFVLGCIATYLWAPPPRSAGGRR